MSEQMPDQLPATDWSSRSLRLNCVGAGLVGKTLCHLMARHIQLNQVINQSQSSAQQAVDFIGAGRPFGIGSKPLTHLEPADIWMITCPDDLIESVGNKIIQSGRLQPGNIIFHCSGAISSKIFQIPKLADISVASVHPIHSFSVLPLFIQFIVSLTPDLLSRAFLEPPALSKGTQKLPKF